MAETELGRDEVKLRVLGKPEANNRVLASVFAHKLRVLVRGLEAVDKSVNGGKRFEYLIIDLAPKSASATIVAQRSSKIMPTRPSVEVYQECVTAIATGRFAVARAHPECITFLRSLAKDAGETFSRAELSINGMPTVRIDEVFQRQAELAAEKPVERDETPKWFVGTVIGSFDGAILESDWRGAVPTAHLRLTAGDKVDIPVAFRGLTIDDMRPVLGKRARVTGKAQYDGTSGLPARIEVSEVPRLIKSDADFLRWGDAFTPFKPDEWEGEQ